MTLQDAINEAVKNAVKENTARLQEQYKKEIAIIQEQNNKEFEMVAQQRKNDIEKFKMEIAKKLLQSGVSLEIVLASIKLSEEEIEVLKKENNIKC